MNSPIVRLYGLMLLLFAALVGFTSYWAVFDADNLKDNPQNRRPLIAEQTVERGIIETADGVTIAESFPVGGGKNPVYVREYPQGTLFGNPVGYSFIEVGRSGIERSENGFLAGERNEFTSIIDQIRDVPQEGDDVTLTIDAADAGMATQALESAIASTRRGERRGGLRGGARPLHRSGPGDGLGARLRPQPGQGHRRPSRSSTGTRARRWSTGPPRAPMSRARR